jgi:hypothetical protein
MDERRNSDLSAPFFFTKGTSARGVKLKLQKEKENERSKVATTGTAPWVKTSRC